MNSSPAFANAASAVRVLSVEVFVKIVDSIFVYVCTTCRRHYGPTQPLFDFDVF